MKRQYLRHDNDFGRQGIIIFDIGANIGSFSLLAAHANPESTIYAFEPETVNFEIFLKSISANNIKNINAYNFAVGNTGGKMKLSLSPNTGGHTLVNDHEFIKRNRISEKYETVDVTSLREFVLENKILIIDFLKMDIEGGEYDIFFHLDDEIFNRISTISMEYHFVDEQKNGDKLKELFEKKGFSVSMNYPMLYATRK
jgi:FkbM family methyltransferase